MKAKVVITESSVCVENLFRKREMSTEVDKKNGVHTRESMKKVRKSRDGEVNTFLITRLRLTSNLLSLD